MCGSRGADTAHAHLSQPCAQSTKPQIPAIHQNHPLLIITHLWQNTSQGHGEPHSCEFTPHPNCPLLTCSTLDQEEDEREEQIQDPHGLRLSQVFTELQRGDTKATKKGHGEGSLELEDL